MTAPTLVRDTVEWQTIQPRAIESPQNLIDGKLPPSLGSVAVGWMQKYLEHGPGDLIGQPYRLDPYQVNFLYRFLEFDPTDGRFFYEDSLLGVGQGNAKTEFVAGVALYKLAGPSVPIVRDGKVYPTVHPDPDIPVLAASYDQANILYASASAMAEPIGHLLDRFDKEMLRKGMPGSLYRVAAVGGANDGKRPSSRITDEYHELVKPQQTDADTRIQNKMSKRGGSAAPHLRPQSVKITTAGTTAYESPCQSMYQRGVRIANGEVLDPSMLMVWYEAEDHWDIDKPDQLRAALRQANPATFVDIEQAAKRYEVDGLEEHKFRRFYLNQWTATAEQWLPGPAWPTLADPKKVPKGAEIALGFDGSYNRDSTGLVGWTLLDGKPHGFVLGHWENPDPRQDWRVPRGEVQATLKKVFDRHTVIGMACDPYRWENEIDEWADLYGDIVTEFPTNSPQRMVRACSVFYSAVVQAELTHDGHPALTRHIGNAVLKENRDGAYITKDGRNSPRKIDLAVAAIIGLGEWYFRTGSTGPAPLEPLFAFT